MFCSNPATGCWRRLWVLCQTTAGDAVLCAELLRGVWQCWRHDECGRVPHVFLSGRGARSLLYCHISTDSWAFCVFFITFHLLSQILKPSEKKAKYQYGGVNSGRPVTPPRTSQAPKKRWAAGPGSSAPPPVGLWPPSLQAASNTLSQLVRMFCLFCVYFLWCEWYSFHFFRSNDKYKCSPNV